MNELPCTALWHATGFGPVTMKTRETSTNVDHTFSRPRDQAERETTIPKKIETRSSIYARIWFELTEKKKNAKKFFKNSISNI